MSTYDALVVTLIVIAVCSSVIFFLGVVAEIFLPWFDRKPRRQATYRD